MSTRGISSLCVEPDPTKQAIITPVWLDDLAALGKPGVPLLVRLPLYAAPDNSFPTSLYKESLGLYRAAGHPIVGIVASEFDAVALNAPLGMLTGKTGKQVPADPTLNDAIQEYTLRVEGVARQLVPHGLTDLILWNEPRTTGTRLDAAVFGSLLYQGAKRAKAAGVKRIWAGALSLLEQFHTDPSGDWAGGYLDSAFGYLKQHGKHDLLVDYLGYNMEGWVDFPYAAKAAQSLKTSAAKAGLPNIRTYVGEWGWENSTGIDSSKALATFLALDGHFDVTIFFQHSERIPGQPHGNGATVCRDNPLPGRGGLLGFFPFGDRLPWYAELARLFRL